jgi:hypothetical protein
MAVVISEALHWVTSHYLKSSSKTDRLNGMQLLVPKEAHRRQIQPRRFASRVDNIQLNLDLFVVMSHKHSSGSNSPTSAPLESGEAYYHHQSLIGS